MPIIQLVFHTAFLDMPWYAKLTHLLLSDNPSSWKSIQITHDHKIKYYFGLNDPTNIPTIGNYFSQINDWEWDFQWKPRLQHCQNKKSQNKIFFTSNRYYENVAISINETIIYDERYNEPLWFINNEDAEWIIEKMMELLKICEEKDKKELFHLKNSILFY